MILPTQVKRSEVNMEYIIGGRSTGKTRKLIEAAKEQGAMVICRNAPAMRKKAEAYGIIGVEFISYDDISSGRIISDLSEWIPGRYMIDEVSDFLEDFFGGECIGITQTIKE
jgi:hypothetical protein